MKIKLPHLPSLSLLAGVATMSLVLLSSARACTWFEFRNDKGHPFIGRTMEWPNDLHGEVARVPRGHDFGAFRTKYGFVGMSHGGLFSDGMNEHGLAASGLWLDESKYPAKAAGALPITQLLPLVLGSAKTVDEAIALLKAQAFYTFGSAITSGLDVTLHFAITDPTGRSVVVEFLKGKMEIFENKVGAMTNDPNFPRQLELWSKYNPSKFNEDTFESFDYSPEGRFCRMAAFNVTQSKVPDDEAAVNRAWSMVNTVDIPQGILYWRWVSDHPQFTSYSIVGDLRNRTYYFRTYTNYDIRKIDLRTIDFATAKYTSDSLFTPGRYREFEFK
jgi:choloylglycine hydrolase